MFIGGQWLSAQDGEEIPTISPVDGQVFGAVSRGKAYEVDLAVKAAQHALAGVWGRPNATQVTLKVGFTLEGATPA
jgi:aldehyde dehydrogenase (NAD+)